MIMLHIARSLNVSPFYPLPHNPNFSDLEGKLFRKHSPFHTLFSTLSKILLFVKRLNLSERFLDGTRGLHASDNAAAIA